MNKEERLTICFGNKEKNVDACNHVVTSDMHKKFFVERCGKCNCLLRVKAGLSGAHCPLEKW